MAASARSNTGKSIEQPATVTDFIQSLVMIVGAPHVITDTSETLRFRRGFRFGNGAALAVVSPANLVEQWRILQVCVRADKIIIMQAANTGLTGGSTPDGNDYDRDIVIISTLRMKTIHLIGDGTQVVCLPGATLDALERKLAAIGREPHSVIGSSCIGASVFGGISNNSGGALVQRGPAYTDMAIYAQVDEHRELTLVNHLGINLGDDPEEILTRVEAGVFKPGDIDWNAGQGHDINYATTVRQIDADTPARYNADPTRLHESAGCAGKIALFAVRLDTFPAQKKTSVFYIGTNKPDTLTEIRRKILGDFSELPIAGEYIHRDAFVLAEKYGKDMFLIIRRFGTTRLPALFALKDRIDRIAERLKFIPNDPCDRLLQFLSHFFPKHLPKRMRDYRDRYEHHLLLKVSESQIEETKLFLSAFFKNAEGNYFECSADEGAKAFLHRFAVAGAAVRYRAIHPKQTQDIVALDVALRRNDREWFETLPQSIADTTIVKLYYGHFLCHVMHQDYVIKKGLDCIKIEHEMLDILDKRGARYPAEHNFGHLYAAPSAMIEHFRNLDPCNCFNPGIGQSTKKRNWVAESTH